MFTDPTRVGAFAVHADALRAGEPDTLFRLLVATTMFQRRSDLQIMRVLQGISPSDTDELCSPDRLLALADGCGCTHAGELGALLSGCDLSKDPETGLGRCTAAPEVACALKRHTVLLKRYGHFGKVPTALALNMRAHGVRDLGELRSRALAQGADPAEAAELLASWLQGAWRVSDKISAMYLSMLTNPDLSSGLAPWSEGVDWTRYVVIDSNVDLFLRAVGYTGHGTYEARRAFLLALAREVDLSEFKPGLHGYNPRLIQQAAYLFMSVSHRRSLARDCARAAPQSCSSCSTNLQVICTLRR